MAELTLYIGNRAYSSWSLRPWLVLKHAEVDFDEVMIPLNEPGVQAPAILAHSPSGKVPVLKHGELTIWESLAISEYIADMYPEARLWPASRGTRAIARAVSAEMASGFTALRGALPMNVRRQVTGVAVPEAAARDIARIQAIWRDCRSHFGAGVGAGGEFLFGHFTIADAMYAPVVTRFETYGIEVDPISKRYMTAILGLRSLKSWIAKARDEPQVIKATEAIADTGQPLPAKPVRS